MWEMSALTAEPLGAHWVRELPKCKKMWQSAPTSQDPTSLYRAHSGSKLWHNSLKSETGMDLVPVMMELTEKPSFCKVSGRVLFYLFSCMPWEMGEKLSYSVIIIVYSRVLSQSAVIVTRQRRKLISFIQSHPQQQQYTQLFAFSSEWYLSSVYIILFFC